MTRRYNGEERRSQGRGRTRAVPRASTRHLVVAAPHGDADGVQQAVAVAVRADGVQRPDVHLLRRPLGRVPEPAVRVEVLPAEPPHVGTFLEREILQQGGLRRPHEEIYNPHDVAGLLGAILKGPRVVQGLDAIERDASVRLRAEMLHVVVRTFHRLGTA